MMGNDYIDRKRLVAILEEFIRGSDLRHIDRTAYLCVEICEKLGLDDDAQRLDALYNTIMGA